MRLPIVADNEGDIILFDSLEDAERYLEPIDVINQRYKVYDGAGNVLSLRVGHDKGLEKVCISEPEKIVSHEGELYEILAEYLSFVNPNFSPEGRKLSDLILEARDFAKDP